MSKRYKGAILSSTPPTTSTSSASGVWTEQQFMQGVASGSWPALAGAPTIGTATAGALNASVAFTAPTYTGSGITGYTATSSPGGITGTGASSPITVSGLTAGTSYTFTVTATTAAGQSSPSAASNSVTPTAPNYIEDVFSTWLYTGTGSAQTITNNIDLSTKGGLVWLKNRSDATDHGLFDTARGAGYRLISNTTDAQNYSLNYVSSFDTTGFSLGAPSSSTNASGNNYASWTFRKQPKFFDVVTWSGNGVDGRAISHNLGSAPGCIIVKRTDSTSNWSVYHRQAGGSGAAAFWGRLNTTDADTDLENVGPSGTPTTTFLVYDAGLGLDSCNINGATYVAYLFAHNAGGFGLTGTDNVISCGAFTTNAAGWGSATLGYEPQWFLWKNITNADDWYISDVLRGQTTGSPTSVSTDPNTNTVWLKPNSSAAEVTNFPTYATKTQSQGFTYVGGGGTSASSTYIYIAIRRGPMKVPTVGTSVFSPELQTPTGGANNNMAANSGFPIDWLPTKQNTGVTDWYQTSRLTNNYMSPNTTAAEGAYTYGFDRMSGVGGGSSGWNTNSTVSYAFKRAPGFFDEVCYTGTGASGQTKTHNLGVTPELMIIKNRGPAGYTQNWTVYPGPLGTDKYMFLNTTAAAGTFGSYWGDTPPTSTGFTVGNYQDTNASTLTYVAYLFATCAGVSKVGSYTGTGALQTVNCGFTSGARFVLIKNASDVGNWYVYDSARGITSGNDPYLLLNDTVAQVTSTNYVDTDSTGFKITAAAPAGLNFSGNTYIFLAIA